jgi:hypothetical protein
MRHSRCPILDTRPHRAAGWGIERSDTVFLLASNYSPQGKLFVQTCTSPKSKYLYLAKIQVFDSSEHRKGLVTDVSGPQRNACPGTLTHEQAWFPCSARSAETALSGGAEGSRLGAGNDRSRMDSMDQSWEARTVVIVARCFGLGVKAGSSAGVTLPSVFSRCRDFDCLGTCCEKGSGEKPRRFVSGVRNGRRW